LIYLPDTNVIVAGLVDEHAFHARALPWIVRASQSEDRLVLSDRTLAEAYAVLSTLPRIRAATPDRAARALRRLIEVSSQTVDVSATETMETITMLAERKIPGRIVFDALIAKAAVKAKVDYLVTFNVRDFRRVWPLDPRMVREP
jgi:predicted nucleic acid-binding protein